MDELIEHVAKPAEILKRVEKLLKPGGMLFLTTPNWGSLTRRMVGSAWAPIHPEHLSYFTPRTLGSLLSKSTKLHAERLRTQNLDILAIMNHYRGGNHEQGVPKAQLRERVENSAVLRAAKQVMNCFLHVSNMGDTIHFLGVKK
jgi:2-polyprenyl-3-methyl-5-hydroxy-6-metoxy-1,4-benzoquinol methylase